MAWRQLAAEIEADDRALAGGGQDPAVHGRLRQGLALLPFHVRRKQHYPQRLHLGRGQSGRVFGRLEQKRVPKQGKP